MENKKLYKIIISLGILSLLFMSSMFIFHYYKTYYSENTNFNDESIFIYIKSGTGLNHFQKQITPFLKDSSTFFNAAYKTKYVMNIKPGKYEIKKGFSNKEIINSLRSKNIPVKVTFNNLERIEDLASKISKMIEADSISLMKSFMDTDFLLNNQLTKESVFAIFLPNTYEFYWNTDSTQFRDRMLNQFNTFWNSSRLNKADRQELTLEQEVEKWIEQSLSKPNKIFGGLPPCPYARKAWKDKKVSVLEDTFTHDYDKLTSGELDVVLIVFKGATLESLLVEKNSLQKNLGKGVVVLEDHPDQKEDVMGYNLNFGKPVLFVQDRKKLKEAEDHLLTTNYYNNFEKEYKDELHSHKIIKD